MYGYKKVRLLKLPREAGRVPYSLFLYADLIQLKEIVWKRKRRSKEGARREEGERRGRGEVKEKGEKREWRR